MTPAVFWFEGFPAEASPRIEQPGGGESLRVTQVFLLFFRCNDLPSFAENLFSFPALFQAFFCLEMTTASLKF